MALLTFFLVVIAVLYFAIHFPRFRRGVFITLGIVFGLGALGGLYLWAENENANAKRERSKNLIKLNEIAITDATLSLGSLGKLQATVTNNSRYTLTDITLNVSVTDCPAKGLVPPAVVFKCTIVGESNASEYSISIPPGQRRAIDTYVSFSNLPDLKPEGWSWSYSIVEVRAEEQR